MVSFGVSLCSLYNIKLTKKKTKQNKTKQKEKKRKKSPCQFPPMIPDKNTWIRINKKAKIEYISLNTATVWIIIIWAYPRRYAISSSAECWYWYRYWVRRSSCFFDRRCGSDAWRYCVGTSTLRRRTAVSNLAVYIIIYLQWDGSTVNQWSFLQYSCCLFSSHLMLIFDK